MEWMRQSWLDTLALTEDWLQTGEFMQKMSVVEVYRLKLVIDEALKQYGASAVSWTTHWSQLVIRKYDYPYSADRSVIFEEYLADEADWQEKRPGIEQSLQALCLSVSQAYFEQEF